jgi:CBS domain containing-hemolysin-like protein
VTFFFQGLVVLLIVLANAFFVAAEYSLVTARRSRLNELAAEGNRRARIALKIMDSPVRFIGTVQLGITTFSILLGAVGEPIVEHWIDDPLLSTGVAFAIAFTVVTFQHVTDRELVAKSQVMAHVIPEQFAKLSVNCDWPVLSQPSPAVLAHAALQQVEEPSCVEPGFIAQHPVQHDPLIF